MLNTKCRGWLFFSFCSCFSLLYEVLNWYSCLRPHKINHLNYRIVDRFTPHTNSIKNESYRWCQSFESIRLSLLFKLEICDGKQSHCLLCAISLISSYEKGTFVDFIRRNHVGFAFSMLNYRKTDLHSPFYIHTITCESLKSIFCFNWNRCIFRVHISMMYFLNLRNVLKSLMTFF